MLVCAPALPELLQENTLFLSLCATLMGIYDTNPSYHGWDNDWMNNATPKSTALVPNNKIRVMVPLALLAGNDQRLLILFKAVLA